MMVRVSILSVECVYLLAGIAGIIGIRGQDIGSSVGTYSHLRNGQGLSESKRKLQESSQCGCSACTQDVLDTLACIGNECHTCGARITWMMSPDGGSFPENNACTQVAEKEFPDVCGSCNPNTCNTGTPTLAPTNTPCTGEDGDPYAPGESGGVCCAGLERCLDDHFGNGDWHYRCYKCCSEPHNVACPVPTLAPVTPAPTSVPTASPTKAPTQAPITSSPTTVPTNAPNTSSPTKVPTKAPTTSLPTNAPSGALCTDEDGDPYAPGESGGVCCTGLNKCLGNHFGDGNWHYRCYRCCSEPHNLSCADPTPTPATPAPSPAPSPTPMPVTQAPSPCGCSSCTQDILDANACDAGGCFSCSSRMNWLMSPDGGSFSEYDSCVRIGNEFPGECAQCSPLRCGPPMDPPDPEKLIWSDEFDVDGLPDSSKWSYDIGGFGWGNNELQYYTDRLSNAYVSEGALHVRATLENYMGQRFTSARLVTKFKGDWTYGRIVVRARLLQCTAVGTWPAIWMLPTDWVYGNWPKSGEIDIMEHVGYDTGVIHGTVHTEAFNHMIGTQVGGSTTTSVEDWHEYEIIWDSQKILFVLDRIKYHEFEKEVFASYMEWPFDEKFHLILNVAVGGNWGAAMGVDDSAFAGNGQIMEVDYVRVYTNN